MDVDIKIIAPSLSGFIIRAGSLVHSAQVILTLPGWAFIPANIPPTPEAPIHVQDLLSSAYMTDTVGGPHVPRTPQLEINVLG